jgi:hypothetical protein
MVTIVSPGKSPNPLICNASEKCRKTRQNSSKLVKNRYNPLIHNAFQKPSVSPSQRLQPLEIKQNPSRKPLRPGNDTRQNSSKVVRKSSKLVKTKKSTFVYSDLKKCSFPPHDKTGTSPLPTQAHSPRRPERNKKGT